MALREVLARFGIEVDDGKLKTAGSSIDNLSGKLRGMVAVVGGAAIVGGIKAMVSDMVDLGGKLTDTSAKLGISTTALQQWQFAGGQVGVGADSMGAALGKLNRNIGEAVSGSAGAKDAFKGLGIDLKDLGSRPIGDVMLDAARGLESIKEPGARAKAAIDLFGKSGADLIPLLGQGDEAIRAMLTEADALGGVLNESTIKALDDAGDASDKFDFAMRGVKAQITLAILPTLTKLGQTLLSSAVGWSKTEQGARFMKAAMLTLGVVAAVAGLAMVAPFIPFLVLVAGAVLLVDDLITGLNGGDSATGRLLDKVFGKGAGKSIFADMRKDIDEFNQSTAGMTFGDKISEGFSRAAKSVGRFFTQDVPEAISYLWKDMSKGIEEGLAGLVKSFVVWKEDLKTQATEAIDAFIAGLVAGLEAGAEKVKGAASALAKSGILGPVASVLELGSPSKWAARVGGHVGEGLAIGLDQSGGEVGGSARGLAQGMQRAIMPGASIGGPRTINQRNNVNVSVQGTGAGAVRTGVASGLGDAGRAALAFLEAGVG